MRLTALRLLAAAVLVLSAFMLLLSCGGSNPTSPSTSASGASGSTTPAGTTATPRAPTPRVTISGRNPLRPGESAQFIAILARADGSTVNCASTAGTQGVWQARGAGTVTQTGLVTAANATGSVLISGGCEGVSGDLLVLVTTGPGYTISGTVRTADGAPASGAKVEYFPYWSVSTDSEGRYQLSPVLAGDAVLKVTLDPWDPITRTVAVSGSAAVDFTLVRTYHIWGTVTETGSGVKVAGAGVSIAAGTHAGRTTTTDGQGEYLFDLPSGGSATIEVTKTGYEAADRTGSFGPDSKYLKLDVVLTPSSAECLQSVTPLEFTYVPSAGGTGSISVVPVGHRAWEAKANDAWLDVVSGATGAGPGTVTFRAAANPTSYGTGFRQGSLTIGCSASQQRSVLVSQLPDCHALITPRSDPKGTQTVAEAAGGTSYVDVLTDSPWSCPWQASSQTDWITISLGANRTGDGSVGLIIAPNATGAPRTGTVSIAEKPWTVVQKG
jgi:hypothetical protein